MSAFSDYNSENESKLNYDLLMLKMKAEADRHEQVKCACHKDSQSSGSREDLAPDGGWGWVVCVGSFMVNFILDGTMFSFGVILLELLEDFHESKAKTAWIGSVLLGLSLILGPFVGWLLDRYSLRQVTIGGALIATSGFALSVFASNVTVLTLTYGVIGGVGFCMMFIPAILVVGLYFTRKRAVATGIATSGSGLGTFAYAYICDNLLKEYHWRGTVLILAGLVLNCAVCGALFRPLQSRKTCKIHRNRNRLSECCPYLESSAQSSTDSPEPEKKLFLERNHLQIEQDVYNSTSVLDRRLARIEIYPSLKYNSLQLRRYSSDVNLNKRRNKMPADKFNPLCRKDIYYSGSVCNVHTPTIQIQVCPNSSSGSSSYESSEMADDRKCCKIPKSETVDFTLFRNFKFLLLLHCMVFWTAHSITLTYLPDMALAQGVSRDQAALLISICGVTNTVGRIGAGLATDFFRISSTHIYLVALVTASVVNFSFPWCNNFWTLAVCSGIFGLCMACVVCLRTIMLAEHLGIERLTSAFSMVALFQGIAFSIDPPVAGLVYDSTSSHLYPFVVSGGMYILSAVFCVPLLCLPKRGNIPEAEIVIEGGSSTDESLLGDHNPREYYSA